MAFAKYLTEFIGTFFLVLTVGLTVTQGVGMAPLAIGCSLMIMVYMGGHVSGAHYNPAVTLAVLLRGALNVFDFVPYWMAQIAGSLAAAYVVSIVIPAGETGANYYPLAPGEGFGLFGLAPWLIEILFTFALCLVVLNCATSTATEGNSFFGLAIGFTIVVAAFAGGPISGGAFNPAVGIGPNVCGNARWLARSPTEPGAVHRCPTGWGRACRTCLQGPGGICRETQNKLVTIESRSLHCPSNYNPSIIGEVSTKWTPSRLRLFLMLYF